MNQNSMIIPSDTISKIIIPDSEVLLKCRVKHVGGNYLTLVIDQIPPIDPVEVVVLKENVAKLKVSETPFIVTLKRNNEFKPVTLSVKSFASAGVVSQLGENGVLQDHQWLQDLSDQSLVKIV